VLAARARALVPAAVQRWVAEHDDPRLRGLVLLNCMTLLMGSNWVVVKESGADMDPWVFTALRFLLAAAAFAPFLAKGWRDPALRDAGLEIGAWSAAGYLTQSLALAHTPASRASLLSTFTVLAVPLLAGLSGAKIKPLVWGCGAAALLGTSLLESGGGAPPNIGDAYSVVSALFFAVQLFRTERISRQLPGGAGGMLPLMALSMATVAVVSAAGAGVAHAQEAAHALAGLQQAAVALAAAAAGALASGGGAAGAAATDAAAAAAGGMGGHPGHAVGELLYTSLCSTDLALLCEMVALQSVTSTEAAMVYSLEPVSGALLAYAFLGDRWGPAGWAGAALILAASLVTQLAGAEEVEQGSEGGQAPAGGQEVGSAAAEQQAE
jgi:drug/metabolite transporter (DMT)-like permease